MKRYFPIALLCSLLLSCFFVGTADAASSYNASAALAYAAQHWADPPAIEGSDCANFVSKCINAGGCPCSNPSSSYLHNALAGSGMGVFYDLALTNVNGSYRIKASDYGGILSPGDVVMYYCSNEVPAHGTPRRQYIHTVLYKGMDANGWLCAYSHTGANNGQAALSYSTTCWVCKQKTVSKAVVFHFNDSSGSPSDTVVTLSGTVHDTDGNLAINSRPSAGYEIGTIPEGGVCTV